MKYLPTKMYFKGYWYLEIDRLKELIKLNYALTREALKNKDKSTLKISRELLNIWQYELKHAEYMLKVSK